MLELLVNLRLKLYIFLMNLSVFASVLQIYETKAVVFMVNIVYPKLHTQLERHSQCWGVQ